MRNGFDGVSHFQWCTHGKKFALEIAARARIELVYELKLLAMKEWALLLWLLRLTLMTSAQAFLSGLLSG